jgi:Kef-type K+ transport system membrane component KefB
VPRGRIPLFYCLLGLATAIGIALSINAGLGDDSQPKIAGTYKLTKGEDDCLGRTFDVVQSGQFITLKNSEGNLGGTLRFRGDTMSGTASCIGGGSAGIQASLPDQKLDAITLDGKPPLELMFIAEAPAAASRVPIAPSSVGGDYTVAPRSDCLGGAFTLDGPNSDLDVTGTNLSGGGSYTDGKLSATVTCPDKRQEVVTGAAKDQTIDIDLRRLPDSCGATKRCPSVLEEVTAKEDRDPATVVANFLIAVVVIMLTARLFGWLAVKIAQPRVMGEVVAGIVLGPTLFGAIAPNLQADVFPVDVIPVIGIVANLGLVFYMFLIGLELDPRQLRGRVTQALTISNSSVAIPMLLGIAIAVPIYKLLAPADTRFVAFAVFMGVAMSITAFPVLARILVERRMLKNVVGATTISAAAIDDLTAWFLIAFAIAVATSGGAPEVIRTIALALGFCAVMFFLVRPLIGRVSTAYDEAGRVPGGWIVAIFAAVLLSAYTTETIGVAVIFGAFIMGLVMPRHAGLTEDVTGRIEDFVLILLLPLFFAFTGLKTNVGLLNQGELWLITLALIGVAIVGKMVGAVTAARIVGYNWHASSVIGTLMNTRGLTELIVLGIALDEGVISQALFAALVLMALVTTFMAGPLLRILDPRNEFGAPVEEEFEEARRESESEHPRLAIPSRSILLAPQDNAGLSQLISVAEPLARSEPPRELIVARLVRPPRSAAAGVRGGLQTENRLLEQASDSVREVRDELIARGIAARSVAFISTEPGVDLSRVAEREEVDLVLADGRRPLLGEGVPRGDVGVLLQRSPSDVAVLVAREDEPVLAGPEASITVPFGGAEHDWAALELGAWLAAATDAPLRLLGAAGDTDEGSRVTRLLADAGLLVQQYSGVSAQPVMAEPGREGVLAAAAESGLLVIGLSARWRQEGLGSTRAAIAKAAPVPILFVRRGTRTGALAPATDMTRFTWSAAGRANVGR